MPYRHNPRQERNKAIIRLHNVGDTYQEIADKLSVSRSTIAGVIYRYHDYRNDRNSSYYVPRG